MKRKKITKLKAKSNSCTGQDAHCCPCSKRLDRLELKLQHTLKHAVRACRRSIRHRGLIINNSSYVRERSYMLEEIAVLYLNLPTQLSDCLRGHNTHAHSSTKIRSVTANRNDLFAI